MRTLYIGPANVQSEVEYRANLVTAKDALLYLKDDFNPPFSQLKLARNEPYFETYTRFLGRIIEKQLG
jgi:hypothetical protein